MTGEITLMGPVLPVGGIRKKVTAARRASIDELILPADNCGDFKEVPEYIRAGMTVHFIEHYTQVVPIIFHAKV